MASLALVTGDIFFAAHRTRVATASHYTSRGRFGSKKKGTPLNADQRAMARPCGLSPSRSSGVRIHAKAVNAADTRMSGASRLLNTC